MGRTVRRRAARRAGRAGRASRRGAARRLSHLSIGYHCETGRDLHRQHQPHETTMIRGQVAGGGWQKVAVRRVQEAMMSKILVVIGALLVASAAYAQNPPA